MRCRALQCLPVLAVALALVPTQASAAISHPFLSAGPPEYEDACGLALAPGQYVSDYYRDVIDTPSGKIGNEDPEGGPCKLALDTTGNLYVNNWHHNVVRFDSSEIPAGPGGVVDPNPSEEGSEPATSVAVDPTTGNVYVAHRAYIAKYEAPVVPGEAPTEKIGEGSLGEAFAVAVSAYPATLGFVYVADAADNTVKVFDPPTEGPVAVMPGEATPQKGFNHLRDGELFIDNNPTSPSYGHLYVLDNIGYGAEHPEGAFDEFNSAGAYRGQFKGFIDAEPSGIAVALPTGNVEVTSGNSEGSRIFLYGPTGPAQTLTVEKTGSGGGSVGSSPVGIACGEACEAEYNAEEHVTLFAQPDAHSNFKGWTVSGPGTEPCPGTGSCSVILLGNVEVSANFEPAPEQTLDVSVSGSGSVQSEPAGISCPGECSEEFAEGRSISLLATPAPHQKIVKWTGCSSQPNLAECKVTMSAAKSVSVEFAAIPPRTLSVARNGDGSGEVTSYPVGISCPGTCSYGFDEGSTVTLIASSDPNATFAGWSGAGCSGTGVCAVTMSEARSVAATFSSTVVSSPPVSAPVGGVSESPPRPTAPPGARLKLRKLKVKGTTATLIASVSGPGRLSAAGKRLKPAHATARVAGGVVLHLSLTAAGKRALARARSKKLPVRVTVGFFPANGAASTAAAKKVIFHARVHRRKHHKRRGRH
jgi:List-Bact-rpt repeat protein